MSCASPICLYHTKLTPRTYPLDQTMDHFVGDQFILVIRNIEEIIIWVIMPLLSMKWRQDSFDSRPTQETAESFQHS